ncbi:MAG: FAD-dependent monooxygenase [Micromonosporaceae bacterium]
MKIVIAGGGLGGLAAALSLHAAGFDELRAYEAAPEIRPLGVGINVLPHAVRELDELGLRDQVREIGLEVASTLYYDQHGGRIAAVPRGRAAGHAWPQVSVHRGALQRLLLDAVQDRLGVQAVVTGMPLRGFEQTGAGVTATLESAQSAQSAQSQSGGAQAEQCDLLIGADGIKSTVRSQLFPDEGDPEWNRCMMFRGVARVDHEFLNQKAVLFAGHHDQRFMLYPIKDVNGEVIFNWGCTIKVDPPLTSHSDWNQRVDRAPLLRRYRGWRCGSVRVTDIIEAADEVFQYPMTDRDPLPQWSFGGVTLLGDAAHPMYPSGSNGTSQAILDARTLAKLLREHGAVPAALRAYDQARIPATSRVIEANRKMADMRVLQVVHERAPDGFRDITEVISEPELAELMRGYQVTAGFEPGQLNARSSLSAR